MYIHIGTFIVVNIEENKINVNKHTPRMGAKFGVARQSVARVDRRARLRGDSASKSYRLCWTRRVALHDRVELASERAPLFGPNASIAPATQAQRDRQWQWASIGS